MFQRQGAAAYKADLSNTIALMDMLSQPQKAFPCVHIAGTNGKGSSAHMISSILQQQGYKTGLYTSPHLVDFRERIRVNGEMIREEAVVSFVEKHKLEFEAIHPSFFEITFAMALYYFREQEVDIVVMETGMGGRLDSSNVVEPIVSLITNIGMDHTQFLGNTLEKIAGEKAGIIKKDIPVIIGQRQADIVHVFERKANEMNSPLYFAEDIVKLDIRSSEKKQCFEVSIAKNRKGVMCIPLLGKYQINNLQSVLSTIYHIDLLGDFPVSDESIRKGLACTVKSTGIQGRWQQLAHSPKIICDTGHNEDGLSWVTKQIEAERYQKLHFILGMVNDKEVGKILSLLPKNAEYYFCKADIPRGLPVEELASKANSIGLKGSAYTSVNKALSIARSKAKINDLIFVGGSTFVVAEVLEGEK
ncbi:MAG: bifunctional folylpolyglutamate synthase/dihydrofolate synthase [Bacteroidales bacterium]|nr:bifunctional folylpolyglutamate synthase/dihydrofolate synthase [Bacteroidales bacterium]